MSSLSRGNDRRSEALFAVEKGEHDEFFVTLCLLATLVDANNVLTKYTLPAASKSLDYQSCLGRCHL